MEPNYIEAKSVVGKYTSADRGVPYEGRCPQSHHVAILYARGETQSLMLKEVASISLCIICILHVCTDRLHLQLDVADLLARVAQPQQ